VKAPGSVKKNGNKTNEPVSSPGMNPGLGKAVAGGLIPVRGPQARTMNPYGNLGLISSNNAISKHGQAQHNHMKKIVGPSSRQNVQTLMQNAGSMCQSHQPHQ
jgi:hypothetical protein